MKKAKSYQELKEEFEINVTLLQKHCEHKEQTDWIVNGKLVNETRSIWAYDGDPDTEYIRVCQICRKIVDKKPFAPIFVDCHGETRLPCGCRFP